MPSLSALGEFRDSFNSIAHEKDDVISRNLPFTDLVLPDTEPPPLDLSARGAPPPQSAPPSFDDLMASEPPPAPKDTGEAAPPGETSPGIGNFDFSAFLGDSGNPPPIHEILQGSEPPSIDHLFDDTGTPVDEGPPSDVGPPAEENPFSSSDFLDDLGVPASDDKTDASFEDFPESTPADTEDTSVPDGLLSGLSDEVESASADSQSDDFSTEDFSTEDFPEEPASGDSPSEDLGGETPDGGLGLDDLDSGGGLPDFDLPATDTESGSEDDGSFDLGGERQDGSLTTEFDKAPLPDFDLPDEGADDGFGLGGESIDLGGEAPPPGLGGEDSGGNVFVDDTLPDLDFPTDKADSSLDDSLSALGLPTEEADSGLGDSLPDLDIPAGEADSDLGDSLPDIDLPSDEADSGLGDSLPDIDFPDTTQDAGSDESGGLPDLGDLGDFASDSIELGSEPDLGGEPEAHSDGGFGDDDFALPGLDEILNKSKSAEIQLTPPPKKGLFGRKKEEAKEEDHDPNAVEEIRLSDEDVSKLLATLAGYPLNLRVACEEIIAEQVILPQQLSKLIRFLVRGASAKEGAALAGEILGKPIVIPKSFEKSTGEAWEEEKTSFAYIFVHNFLPVLRLFAAIAVLAASIVYLGYKFIYIPHKAETLYRRGYERIYAGEYQRANDLFSEAFVLHRKKGWFYQYAEGFRDQRRYMLAEAKYEELLRYYPRDKKGVLDYAHLQTYYLMNYDKANRLLQRELLDYAPNDFDGLLAAGDNFMAWGDSDPSRFFDKYEDARFSYARVMENYGRSAPVVERMMIYFIRTDNLKEVLPLRYWFDGRGGRRLSPEAISELGGYLLDKQLEEVKGVPNLYLEAIENVRPMLLEAVRAKPELPEPHYHLARYFKNRGNVYEERLTLENAIRAFDLAETETVRRRLFRVDTHYRYAELLTNNKQFFPAEENLVRGIELYEDFVSRNLITPSVQLGKLYAAKGDLEYFVKTGDMQTALNDYHTAEGYNWSPPEIQFRMGSAYYQLEDWRNALDYLFKAAAELPQNRRVLYALGNTAYRRGNYFAAQGYYDRLLDILESQRAYLPVLLPNDRPEFLELGERMMMARNNAGVVYEALANQTGNREFRSRALSLYAESARAWDSITRDPETMIRRRIPDGPDDPGANLGLQNASNALRPVSEFSPRIFPRIDKDALEPSRWEELASSGGLSN
jgi:tetratricopeptide (TPR) repeat protein